MKILVGCCGFPKSMRGYISEYKVVELQTTFYRVVREQTAQRWRSTAPDDFIFIVKAFQGITHNASSPTWRRSNIKPSKKHGDLKPSEEVYESWDVTRRICELLKAPICIIQTSHSFKDTPENLENAETFFSSIERGNLQIGFEPRGWSVENISKICRRHGLIHVTDPFLQDPTTLTTNRTAYLRLHGSPPGRYMYRYSYSDEDLKKLHNIIRKYDADLVFVMFNNVTMEEDSKRFMKLVFRS
ncbi:MAG: DUF72 domain-containing protein [Nitrososphaerota archaeon]